MASKIIYFILFFTTSVLAQGTISFSANQVMTQLAKQGTPSYILNPQCQKNEANITDTNNILTRTASGGLGDLGTDCAIDAGTSGHLASWDLRAYPNRLESQNCEAIGYYKGDASLYKIDVVQNSAVVASTQLTSATNGQLVSLNFPCGSDNSQLVTLEVEATSASAAAINFIWLHAGEATNIGDAAQASFWGSIEIAGTTNCNWDRTGAGSNSYGNNAADADCNNPTATGNATTASGKIPGGTFTNLIPGRRYRAMATMQIIKVSATDTQMGYRLTDGTNNSPAHISYSGTNAYAFPASVQWDFVATSSSAVIQVQTLVGNTGATARITNEATDRSFYLSLYSFPTASEQVFRVGAPGLEWTAFTPTGSWVTNTSYTGRYQCSNGNLSVRVLATLTGAPDATPFVVNLPSNFTIDTNALLSTISATTGILGTGVARDTGANVYPVLPYYSSTTAVAVSTLRDEAGTSSLYVDSGQQLTQAAPFTWGNTDTLEISFSVPVTASSPCPRTPMPLLSQAVTTSSAGVEIVNRARINNNGSVCSTDLETGDWISSLTYNGTGDCTLSFTTGTFSATPNCFVTSEEGSAVTVLTSAKIASLSSTGVRVRHSVITSGSSTIGGTNNPVHILCMGPK